ncbi:MAG: hypothetical protein AAGF77_04670 [Bacteroidota bacterium]
MWKKGIGLGLVWILGALLGCEELLEEVDLSDQQVHVFAPLDGAILSSNTVNLNWDQVEFATAYRLQLAAPDFENATQVLLDSLFVLDTLDQVANQIQRTLKNGPYQWRIKALNANSETPYTLNGFAIQGDADLDLIPPSTPQLTAPANQASQTGTTVNFTWNREDVAGTREFDSIFIYNDEARTDLLQKALGANKAYSATIAAGTYFWVVNAYDTAGNESGISQTFTFTINE